MEKGFLFKDVFSKELIMGMSAKLKNSYPGFDEQKFVDSACAGLTDLELKQRAQQICDCLKKNLPDHYPKALNIILNSFESELTIPELKGFEGFYYMPFAMYVAQFGLEHFDLSMEALNAITRRFTAEDAIRPYLTNYPDRTMRILQQWVHDDNVHVRRLVSEGTRPRLPWAQRLPAFQKDPNPVIELLEHLKSDPELYVRRSVANNLNDIAKDNPGIVIKTLERWSKLKNKDTHWIINHASRSLIKEGNPRVLKLLGFDPETCIDIKNLRVEPGKIKIGEKINFTFEVISKEKKTQKLMIDYIIHHRKSNGKKTPKVFKLSQKKIAGSERITISKNHAFKEITTRAYYSGEHTLEIQINGKICASQSFFLEV